jgi:hypothetical protein
MATGYTFGRFSHRDSAALPGAGAYTTAQAWHTLEDQSVTEVTFYLTYTRGAAGGYPQFRVELGNGTESGVEQVIAESPTIVGAVATRSIYDETLDVQALHPSDANAVTRPVTLQIPRGTKKIRLLAAEVGVVGTPGTCAITVVGGSGR